MGMSRRSANPKKRGHELLKGRRGRVAKREGTPHGCTRVAKRQRVKLPWAYVETALVNGETHTSSIARGNRSTSPLACSRPSAVKAASGVAGSKCAGSSHHVSGSASCSASAFGFRRKNASIAALKVDCPWRMSQTLLQRRARCRRHCNARAVRKAAAHHNCVYSASVKSLVVRWHRLERHCFFQV